MSYESEAEKVQLLEQRIKELEEKLKETELKPVTQHIANQHVIQGNNINNSNLNANVHQHGNSLRTAQINEDFENDEIGNTDSDDQNDDTDDKFNYFAK